MPELPEVETVRRSLAPHVVGRTIEVLRVRNRRLREPVPSARLRRLILGRRVRALRRRGKYLLFDLEGGAVLLAHLGMSGRLGVFPRGAPLRKHDHLILGLSGGRELRLNDARRFGLLDAFLRSAEAAHPRLRHLGCEPLGPAFGATLLAASCRGKSKPVKNHLMDSRVLVGVGNIYACESLWRARIDPRQAAGRLSRAQLLRLAEAVVGTLEDALAAGGTTLRDFRDANGEQGYFAVALKVYGKAGEPCPRCGRAIRRIVQAGRATFFCPGCQRRR